MTFYEKERVRNAQIYFLEQLLSYRVVFTLVAAF